MYSIHTMSLETLYKKALYPSRRQFIPLAKRAGFAPDKVKEFLNAQTEQQILSVKPPPQGKFEHGSYDIVMMADLMDVSRWSKNNSGYKWILNVMEFHSRYVWSVALKDKTAHGVAEALRVVLDNLEQIQGKPWRLQMMRFIADKGGEFLGKVNSVLSEGMVSRLWNTVTRKSTAPVERFNGTLLLMIRRYMLGEGTTRWVDVLPDLITRYNNTVHSSTGIAPIEALKRGHKGILRLNNKPPLRLKVGDTVRTRERLALFDKRGVAPKLSMKQHTIVRREHEHWVLDDGSKYLEQELVKTPKTTQSNANDVLAATERAETAQRRTNRRLRREMAVGYEATVNEDGMPVLKSMLLPTSAKRTRKPREK